MKFVCDRCQTRYSIADEKVRQKILRIRCKTCGNVIVVQGERSAVPGGDGPAGGGVDSEHFEAARTEVSSGPKGVPSSAPKTAPSSAPRAAPSSAPKSGPKAAPSSAPKSGPKAAPSSAPKPAVHGPPPAPPAAAAGPDPLGGRVEWYLAIGGVRSGPFSRAEAARRILSAEPGKAVHVWKEGMPGWKPSDEVSVIARELNLLRPPSSSPPPPPAPAKVPSAPPPSAPPKVAAMPPTVAKAAKAAHDQHAPLFPGKPLKPSPAALPDSPGIAVDTDSEAFAEITTKKAKALYDLSKEPDKGSFADSTTKKGKSLGALEADPLRVSPAPALAENDRTPPPVQPLPPVGAKAKPATASSSAGLPAVPAVSFHQPGIASPAASAHAMPVVPAASTAASVPLGEPDLGGFSDVIRAVAASDPPSGPAFSGAISPLVPETLPAQEAPELLGRSSRPGLKYLVGAGAIVVLVILIVMVTLRMDTRKVPDAVPTHPQTTEEPATVPEPKPVVAEPPKPVPPVPAEEKPAPTVRSTGKHGSGKSSRRMDVGPAPARQPSPKSPAKPGLPARPNPFDEAKTVSQSQISAVVRNKANQDALKSCYERALKMDNHLTSGRIDVTVSIGTSGAVQRVVINAPSSFILVEPCIKSAVKRWVFPPNVEEYGTNFPLIMQGGM